MLEQETISKNRWRSGLIYVLVALAMVAALAWATQMEIARNPARDATTELGPYGLVTVRLTTNPNPALATGTVQLSFMPMDSWRRSVPLDAITFEFGPEGSDKPVGGGQTQPMADSSGMFMGGIQFPAVGNWWIRAVLKKGDMEASVRFTLYVKPAQ